MAVTQSKVTFHAPTHSQSCALSILKLLTDHTTITRQLMSHIKTPTEDITMDGLEVFSPLPQQSEDTMLTHMKLETDSVKSIGEWMLNSLSSRMDTTCHTWTPDQEELGDFGTGNWPHAEDGQCGDTSIPTTTEEPGLGLTLNHTQIAEPFEELFHDSHIYLFKQYWLIFKRFIFYCESWKKLNFLNGILGYSLIFCLNLLDFYLFYFCMKLYVFFILWQ